MTPAPAASRAAALVVAVALLAGCSSDVRGELRADVADITRDANTRDADGVRSGVDALLQRVDEGVRSGELTGAEAAEITAAAQAVRERAVLLEEDLPSPAPTRSPSRSPSPTPSPTPSPSPTVSPTPSPSPTRTSAPPTTRPPSSPEPTATEEPTADASDGDEALPTPSGDGTTQPSPDGETPPR